MISSNILHPFLIIFAWDSLYAYLGMTDVRLCVLLIFSSFSVFQIRLPQLTYLTFTHSLFCLLKSAIETASEFFISVITFFNIRVTIW